MSKVTHTAAEDAEQVARIERYHRLVDREFLEGLTPDEDLECERLGAEIDAYYAPFYEDLINNPPFSCEVDGED